MTKDKLQKTGTQAVVTWEDQLAAMATSVAEMENNVGGQFFSLKGGVLTWNDMPMPNNQMFIVIVDAVMENVYYEGKFDANVPQSPVCFAFGRDEAKMKPHEVVVKAGTAQNDICATCQHNEWGSSDVGRGKACRNTRRLAVISAGQFVEATKQFTLITAEEFTNTAVGFLKLPVTSVKGYSTFVKQVAAVLKRPPFAIVTKVKVVPDQKSQFKVLFEPLMNLPDEVLPIMVKRNKEIAAIIEFPYTPMEEPERPQQKPRGSRKY